MLLFEWMARAALLTALIGVTAWLLEEALRSWKRATRFVWLGALATSVLVAALALLAPELWPESLKRSGGVIVLPDVQSVQADGAAVASATAVRSSWSVRDFALGLWFSASLLLLLRWLHGWQKLRAVRARWSEAILAGERVLISDNLGPAVVGLRCPRVVIPSWLLLSAAERQRMIVRHEAEHVRAGDPWLLALAPLLVALFPWNPALWWQLQRLRIAIELDCDARVLRGGVPALEYGSMLLDIAGGTTVLQSTLAALSEPRTALERRIRAMTPIRYRYALARAASFTALAAITLVAALVASAPAAPPVVAQERPAPAIPQQEGRLLIVLDGKLLAPTAKLELGNRELNTIEVLDPADARQKYGQRGRFGAVVVTTRPRREVPQPDVASADRALKAELEARLAQVLEQQQETAGPRGSIRGQVLIAETGEPAASAQVTIGDRGTVTDAQGRYLIRDVPAGDHVVEVRMKGYIGRQEVAVGANTMAPTMRLSAMSEAELARFENAELREKTGVEIEKAALQKIRLRGQTDDLTRIQPLIYIDGVLVEPSKRIIVDGVEVEGRDKILQLIDPSLIESIEVIKGAAAATLYGERAVNGVILITTKKR